MKEMKGKMYTYFYISVNFHEEEEEGTLLQRGRRGKRGE
jgi:hypothetical protein